MPKISKAHSKAAVAAAATTTRTFPQRFAEDYPAAKFVGGSTGVQFEIDAEHGGFAGVPNTAGLKFDIEHGRIGVPLRAPTNEEQPHAVLQLVRASIAMTAANKTEERDDARMAWASAAEKLIVYIGGESSEHSSRGESFTDVFQRAFTGYDKYPVLADQIKPKGAEDPT